MTFAVWQNRLWWNDGDRVRSASWPLVELAGEAQQRPLKPREMTDRVHEQRLGTAGRRRVWRACQIVDLLLEGAALGVVVVHAVSLLRRALKSNEPGGSREEASPGSSTSGG